MRVPEGTVCPFTQPFCPPALSCRTTTRRRQEGTSKAFTLTGYAPGAWNRHCVPPPTPRPAPTHVVDEKIQVGEGWSGTGEEVKSPAEGLAGNKVQNQDSTQLGPSPKHSFLFLY